MGEDFSVYLNHYNPINEEELIVQIEYANSILGQFQNLMV